MSVSTRSRIAPQADGPAAARASSDKAHTALKVNGSVKPELRILHVFDSLGAGGAETWLLALLRFFSENHDEFPWKVHTDVLLTGGQPSLYDDEARRLGANLFYMRYSRHNLLQFSRSFRRLLRERKYDAIHDHQDFAAGVHFLMGIGELPPARVAHVHNPVYQIRERNSDLLTRIRQRVGKKLVEVVATSIAGTSEQLIGEYGFSQNSPGGIDTQAAYCGFDVSRFSGDRESHRRELLDEFSWPSDSRIVLFVGRLGGDELKSPVPSHKNPSFALEVFKSACERDPRLRMLFAGEKSVMYPVLDARVTEAGLADRVKFLGIRGDIPHLMLGSDVLLFPSSAEGLGMVVVEAQAAGLPVIASDTTPRECLLIPEMVEFLPLNSGINKWADALLAAAEAKSKDHRACNATVAASKFSIEESARHLVEIYLNK